MIHQRQPINAAWTEASTGMAILWWTPQRSFSYSSVGSLHLSSYTNLSFFARCWNGQYCHTHTDTAPGHRVQTYTRAMSVIWLRSTGTAEVRTRRGKQQANATLVPAVAPVPKLTHKHNTCLHMHKSRLTTAHCSLLMCTQWHTHSWARTSHTHKHMHSWAHVYTGWTDADRCERWGSTSRTFAHPTHQSTFHTDCMIHCVHTLFPPPLFLF